MALKYEIIYTPMAEEDIESIYQYYYFIKHDEEYADRIYFGIIDSIETLEDYPKRIRIVDWEPGQSAGVRVKNINDYCALYIVDDDSYKVYIISVFYGKSDMITKLANRLIHLI